MKKNIALVAGGYSGEYAISIESAHTIEKNIDANKYNVFKIIITSEGWFYNTPSNEKVLVDKNDFSITVSNQKIKMDAVFIGIHGTPGEDGKLQGYFEMLGIPYTSCNSVVSALTFNKIFCNRVVAHSAVVNVSKSIHIIQHQIPTLAELLTQITLPVFVKPAEGGSSLATTKVKNADELLLAIHKCFEVDSQAMIEEFVKGREFSQGVYQLNHQIYSLPITEIISSKEFFDYEAKYTKGISNEITPANLEPHLEAQMHEISKKIFRILNCKGFVRIDYILEENTNQIYFLEINTMPGQSENSIIPQQVRASGSTLQQFYGNIIEECLR